MNGLLLEATGKDYTNDDTENSDEIYFFFTYSDLDDDLFNRMGVMEDINNTKEIIIYDNTPSMDLITVQKYDDFSQLSDEVSASFYKMNVDKEFYDKFMNAIKRLKDNLSILDTDDVFKGEYDYMVNDMYMTPKFFAWLFEVLGRPLFNKEYMDITVYDFIKNKNLVYVKNSKIKNI